MRIAICISGQLRTWKKCYGSWFKFIEKIKQIYNATDVDIFCHTWTYNTLPNELVNGANNNGFGNEVGNWHTIEGDMISEEEISRFLTIINPKSYLIESKEKNKSRKDQVMNLGKIEEDIYGEPSHIWTASQFYSVMRSAHLKKKYELENGFRYDICFRFKYDLFFTDDDIERINDKTYVIPKHNTIYSCHTAYSQNHSIGFPFFRLGDIFWYSESVSFDRICDFYRFLPIIGRTAFVDNTVFIENAFYFYAKIIRLSIRSLPGVDPKMYRTANHLELKDKFGMPLTLGNHEII